MNIGNLYSLSYIDPSGSQLIFPVYDPITIKGVQTTGVSDKLYSMNLSDLSVNTNFGDNFCPSIAGAIGVKGTDLGLLYYGSAKPICLGTLSGQAVDLVFPNDAQELTILKQGNGRALINAKTYHGYSLGYYAEIYYP